MILVLFNTLLFLIPLIFYKNTSELFEFNKIIIVYIFTILIASFWAYNSIAHKKFIFRRTILDIPLILYLLTLFVSSLFSIDPRTSWLGYYSRFNGGLISQICYVVLYWAFVSNLNAKQSLKSLYYILTSTLIASILAILEHFGFFATCGIMGLGYTNSCWVQDVQNRVFSTLGQPNWLAALLTALIPISWSLGLKNKFVFLFSLVFFVTLLFTKSRSGLLAFGVESLIFWGYIFWKEKFKYLKEFIILLSISIVLFFAIQAPKKINVQPNTNVGPALETGGTESGTIRKYVWLGAINIFKHYPLFGSGPETFAFSFPQFKPVGHNLTSEWDFIYNKAHNEYLNYLATTGLFGFLAYIAVIIYSLIILIKSKRYDLTAGYAAILITNFFGFSVVTTSLLFFLIPALTFTSNVNEDLKFSNKISKNKLRLAGFFILFICSLLIYKIYSYWTADIHYNKARNYNRENKLEEARKEIEKTIKVSPNEPLYIAELSLTNKDIDLAAMALDLNQYNQNVRNILISNLNSGSKENQDYLLIAEQIAEIGTQVAPMNPKIFYQLGILNLKNNKIEIALINLEKAVALKPNHKEGRFALGLTYIDVKKYEKAKENLEYILKNIDPNDELTKKYLDQAKSASE